jgi:hypothetical protein
MIGVADPTSTSWRLVDADRDTLSPPHCTSPSTSACSTTLSCGHIRHATRAIASTPRCGSSTPRSSPSGGNQGRGLVPQVVEPQPIQAELLDRRGADQAAEVAALRIGAPAAREHQPIRLQSGELLQVLASATTASAGSAITRCPASVLGGDSIKASPADGMAIARRGCYGDIPRPSPSAASRRPVGDHTVGAIELGCPIAVAQGDPEDAVVAGVPVAGTGPGWFGERD